MTRQLFKFHGGLHLPDEKAISLEHPISNLPLPDVVVIPLRIASGPASHPIVSIGDQVLTGQRIAVPQHVKSAPVHASISGEVTAIEERYCGHPSGMPEPCIVITGDGEDRWAPRQPHSLDEALSFSAEKLKSRLDNAGIVGLGGASFSTSLKVEGGSQHSLETLIINGAECEPFITADHALMREQAHRIMEGITLLNSMLTPDTILFGVEDNKPDAIRALEAARKDFIEHGLSHLEIVTLPTLYPSGGEKQLIKILTGIEISPGTIPAQQGFLCVNAGTAAAIADAILDEQPLISRVVTLSGDRAVKPGNYRIRIGTLLEHALKAIDNSTVRTPSTTLRGGPLMGVEQNTLEVPITPSSNCFILGSEAQFPESPPAQPCTRCGQCEQVCPVSLLPQQLYLYAKNEQEDQLTAEHLMDCIECGACEYVCPSHLPLVQHYRAGKGFLKQQQEKQAKAAVSKQRFEARQERLEEEKKAKEAKRKATAERARRLREQKAAQQQHAQGKDAPKDA